MPDDKQKPKGRTTSMEKAIERLNYNAHDFGEMGKFIRLEYAENIVRDTFVIRDN